MPKEIWIEDEDDEVETVFVPEGDPIIYKHVTFNEWLIIVATILGLVFYYIKVRYCNNWAMLERKTNYNKWMGTKKVIEELIEVNNPPDPWGGIDDEQTADANKIQDLIRSAQNRGKVGVITSVTDSWAQIEGQGGYYESERGTKRRLISDMGPGGTMMDLDDDEKAKNIAMSDFNKQERQNIN